MTCTYGKVILPFTVLRRLDCVLEPTKAAVLAEHAARKKAKMNAEPFLLRKAKQSFYNTLPRIGCVSEPHRSLGGSRKFPVVMLPLPFELSRFPIHLNSVSGKPGAVQTDWEPSHIRTASRGFTMASS
jgi:hypothetical protein